MLTALCQLRDLPDKEVPDRDAGLDALRKLKELALSHDLVAREELDKGVQHKRAVEERTRNQRERAAKLESLCIVFQGAVVDANRQKAGYVLEELLRDLFAIFELEYRKPYRTETQQIDDSNFLSFDYLVKRNGGVVAWEQKSAVKRKSKPNWRARAVSLSRSGTRRLKLLCR